MSELPSRTSAADPTNLLSGKLRLFAGFDALVAVALLLGIGSLAWGLANHPGAITIAWQPDGRRAVLVAFAAAAAAILTLAWLKRPLRLGLVLMAVIAAASAVGPGPVAAALLLLASATQLGVFIAPGEEETSVDLQLVVSCAAGLACYAVLLQAVARVPLHYPLVYLLLLAAPLMAMPPRAWTFWRRVATALTAKEQDRDIWNIALWGIGLTGLMIRLLGALAPEAGMDALNMHLVMPGIVARDHQWLPDQSGFIWAWIPKAVNWIYALVYLPAGESATRLVNFMVDALVLVGCAGAARYAAGLRAAAVAAAVYGSAPVGYLLTTSLFVENVWALWLGSALLLASWMRGRTVGWRIDLLLGLLLGAAVAAKVMTVFAAPVFAYLLWERLRRDGRHAAQGFVVVMATTVIVGGWPYAVAWWETGNPMFPFMNSVFRSPLYATNASFDNPTFKHALDVGSLYDATFATDRYLEAAPGGFGLLWLALLPAGLVAAITRGGRWSAVLALGSVVFVAAVFQLQAYLRYIAPLYPLWASLIGISLAGRRGVVAGTTAVVTLLGALAGLMLSANATWWYRNLPPTGPLDPSAYRQWEAVMRPEGAIVRRANELGLRHVLWLGRGYYAGLQASITTNSWHQQSGWEAIRSTADFHEWTATHRFDSIVLAAGTDPCTWVWLCDLVQELGEPELALSGAKLFVVPEDRLYNTEKLKDPELTGAPPAWGGDGEWDKAAGVMQVNATRLFSQAVPVTAERRYLYAVKVRCHTQSALFRMQVNFLGADGTIVTPLIETALCTNAWQEYRMPATAPAGAVTAIVYAVGQSTDRDVDVDSVSFRE